MSEKTEKQRHPGQYKPGQSGNPAGRPKGLERVVREYVAQQRIEGSPLDGWQRLAERLFSLAMGNHSATPRDQVAAAKLLCERAYGQAKQTVNITDGVEDGDDMSRMTDEELDAIIDEDERDDAIH